MRRPKKSTSLLEDLVYSLVKSFGTHEVTEAVKKASAMTNQTREASAETSTVRISRTSAPTITDLFENLRLVEPDRYEVLNEFYDRLKSRSVLPETQDIRQFAQIVGLKHVEGKSRKEMVTVLIRSLSTISMEVIKSSLSQVDKISEDQRKRGFSVLTDKLVSKE